MWGQGIYFDELYLTDRIIPMRVGTSTCTDLQLMREQDHPHACGDKALCCCALDAYSGSSPCVWGQVEKATDLTVTGGIIPMRVGTRTSDVKNADGEWDHPHACGDKTTAILGLNLTPGSSPCVWGQVTELTETLGSYGIIPMRVGTSIVHVFLCDSREDHPHACGDKLHT